MKDKTVFAFVSGLALTLAFVLLSSTSAQQPEKPAPPAAQATPAPKSSAPTAADLVFTVAENEALNKILRAGQAQDSERVFITTVLEAADKSLKAARWPNAEREIQKAGEQRLMGLKLMDKLAEDSKKLQAQFDAWLRDVRTRANAPTGEPDLQNRRLVMPQGAK